MIYFDNAATGGTKPRESVRAAESVIEFLCANPGRSGHRLSVTGAKIVEDCRETLARGFGADPSRVIMTKNCTEALNIAILGGIGCGTVVTTVYEHNSVLRPLRHLERSGKIRLKVISDFSDSALSEAEKIPDLCAMAVTSVSNVTGEVLPLENFLRATERRDVPLIIDGAQGAGHIPFPPVTGKVCLAIAGHKGLGGIMGSGALILGDGFSPQPILFGGTGTDTFNEDMPKDYPERLEGGTLALPAVASLLEGARVTLSGVKKRAETLVRYTSRLIDGLKGVDGVTVYSAPNPAGIVSFSVKENSQKIADTLNYGYDVAVRGGLHCAPLAHAFLGTEKDGLVRASLSEYNSVREIDYFVRAVSEITKSF